MPAYQLSRRKMAIQLAAGLGLPSAAASAQSRAYSKAVVAAGLQGVDDLRLPTATGPRTAPNKSVAANMAALNALGYSVDREPKLIYMRKSGELSRWDFTGYSLMVDGDGVDIRFVDCKFGRRDGHPLLVQGWNDGKTRPRTTMSYCDFDYTVPAALRSNNAVDIAAGSMAVDHSRFHDCPANFLHIHSSGSLTVTRSFLQAYGKYAFVNPKNAAENTHSEAIMIRSGTCLISECLIDSSDGRGIVPDGVLSGAVVASGAAGPAKLTIERSIIGGLEGIPVYYTLYFGRDKHPLAVELRGNLIERPRHKGGGDYLVREGVQFAASGNRDFKTGAPIL